MSKVCLISAATGSSVVSIRKFPVSFRILCFSSYWARSVKYCCNGKYFWFLQDEHVWELLIHDWGPTFQDLKWFVHWELETSEIKSTCIKNWGLSVWSPTESYQIFIKDVSSKHPCQEHVDKTAAMASLSHTVMVMAFLENGMKFFPQMNLTIFTH